MQGLELQECIPKKKQRVHSKTFSTKSHLKLSVIFWYRVERECISFKEVGLPIYVTANGSDSKLPAIPHSKEHLATHKPDSFQVHCIIMDLFSPIQSKFSHINLNFCSSPWSHFQRATVWAEINISTF